MILVAGDSFVYGSELKDCVGTHSRNTFAAILAEDFECVAWPGFGNDSIARTSIERCEQGGITGAIVSWTFPGRYEFRFNYDTGQRKSPWYTVTPWTLKANPYEIQQEFHANNDAILDDHVKTIVRAKQTGVAEFAESFYKHVGGSEYWEVYSSLKEIVYLQNYFKIKQIPFMFTCADNSIIYNHTVLHSDSIIVSLIKQIDHTHWFWFPGGTRPQETTEPRGFYQWALENKYKVGTTHPLEEAHAGAADLMRNKFNELVKNFIQ
jgi:hypothetical protein